MSNGPPDSKPSCEWLRQISEAQRETTVEIGGQSYRRLRYGSERPDCARRCHDCAVELGQLHVFGCLIERCPRCGDQRFGCGCEADEGARQ